MTLLQSAKIATFFAGLCMAVILTMVGLIYVSGQYNAWVFFLACAVALWAFIWQAIYWGHKD